MTTLYSLVGDVGGTNARFALSRADSFELEAVQQLSSDDYPDLEKAVAFYLGSHPDKTISRACMAVAGPVINGKVHFTNSPWKIDQKLFQAHFKLDVMELINDFAAQALAVPHLSDSQLLSVGPTFEVDPEAVRLVIGPGTGLGVCGLVETANGWIALPGEGGNADIAPVSERDLSVWHYVRKKLGDSVGWERILSGSGLELLYEAHTSQAGNMDRKPAPDITRLALEDEHSIAWQVVDHFCELLGNSAGNAALTFGARGGVYIAGGIIPRIKKIFLGGSFRNAFDNRDKMQHYMKSIPTSLITAEYPGLMGAAAYLDSSRNY